MATTSKRKLAADDPELVSQDASVQSENSEYSLLGEKLSVLAQAFENAPDGIQITDMSGTIVYANKAIERIYGFTPEEQRGKHVGEMNAEPGFADTHILPSIKSTGRWEGEVLVKHKDGRIFTIWLAAALVKDDQGEPIALTGITRDISERKRSDAALAESEEKYRKLMDLANDAIFVADAETGTLVEANQKGSQLIGRPLSEIIGMHQSKLHPPDKAELYRDIFMEYVAKGQGVTVELLARHVGGRDIPVEISSSVFKLGGKLLIKGIFRDLTTRNRAKKLSDSLNEISKTINSSLDADEILNRLVACSAGALGSETTVILLRQKSGWTVECGQNIPAEMIGSCLNDRQIPHVALAATTQNPVVINDLESEGDFNTEFMKNTGIRSTMVVPLIVKDVVIGCKTFSYHSSAITFTSEQIDFAVKLGATLSLALENARLFSEQQRIASTLQKALLVVPEKLPHIEFGHLYRSASEAALVGGDFYDLFTLQGDRLGIVIGDVSGKGLEAAVLTSTLKHMIKSYAYEGHSPGAIMSKTNIVIMKETDSTTFVTAFVGILDTQSGVLTYCCAGHPPPIVKRQNGDIDLLDTSGLPIGVLDFLEPLDKQQLIKEGDLITLYTDGVIEARGASNMFGESRLIDFLRNTTKLSAAEAPGRILDELTRCGYMLSDDLAVVSLSLDNSSLVEG